MIKILSSAVFVLFLVTSCRSTDKTAAIIEALGEIRARLESPESQEELRLIVEREAKRLAQMGPEGAPVAVSELVEIDNRESIVAEPVLFLCYRPILTVLLYRLGKDSVPHLVDALKQGKGSITVGILLGRLNEREHLRYIYESATGKTKFYAAVGLAQAGEADVLPFLLEEIPLEGEKFITDMDKFFREKRYRECLGVFQTLAGMGEKFFDVLYKELTGPEGKRRRNAWVLLQFFLTDERNKLIARLLEHPDEEIRAAAAGLILPHTREGAELLVKVLQEEDSDKVFEAAKKSSFATLSFDIRIHLAALETKDFRRREKIANLVKALIDTPLLPRFAKECVIRNARVKALLDSVELPQGKVLLDRVKNNSDDLLDSITFGIECEIEMYGQAIAVGGDELLPDLVGLVASPTNERFTLILAPAQVLIAAEALKNINARKAVEELTKLLTSDDIKVCERTLCAISRIGTEEAKEALFEAATKHSSAHVRAYAVGLLPDDLLQQTIEAYADEKEDTVRREIIWKAAESGDPRAASFLRAAHQSLASKSSKEAPGLSADIIRGLAALGLKEDEALFLQLLTEGKRAAIRAAAAHGLGIIGDKKYVEALQDSLRKETDIEAKEEVIEALGRIGDEKSLSILRGLLKNKDLCTEAAIALGYHGYEETLSLLFDELFLPPDPDDSYKVEKRQLRAAVVLTYLNEDTVRKELNKRLDSNDTIPFAAKWLDTWLGGSDFLEEMYKALSRPVYPLFYSAAALGRSGEHTGGILAVEAVIYSPWLDKSPLGFRLAVAVIARLFPDAPQIDYDRYYGFANCPQFEQFINWYKYNRFDLEFDSEARLFRLRD